MTINAEIEVLERTPALLDALLTGLSPAWTHANEGGDTWSPYDVVGHLIDGERDDWIPRVRIILKESENRTFEPFDRFTHIREQPRPSLANRLRTFRALRSASIAELVALQLSNRDLERTGVHPAFGPVTLRQLLATWVAHDLNHLAQISRVMAHQLTTEVGPWRAYLRVLDE